MSELKRYSPSVLGMDVMTEDEEGEFYDRLDVNTKIAEMQKTIDDLQGDIAKAKNAIQSNLEQNPKIL